MQRVPLLSLLAGVSAPGQRWTKNSTHNTWRRFGYKHAALPQVPGPPRPHSGLGPDAKAGRGALPWKLQGAQGKVRGSSTGQEGAAG